MIVQYNTLETASCTISDLYYTHRTERFSRTGDKYLMFVDRIRAYAVYTTHIRETFGSVCVFVRNINLTTKGQPQQQNRCGILNDRRSIQYATAN